MTTLFQLLTDTLLRQRLLSLTLATIALFLGDWSSQDRVFTIGAAAYAQASANVSGRVSDSSGRVSLEGATVRIKELGLNTSSGRDGSYSFNNVPPGKYTVVVDYLGAEPVERSIEVVAGEPTVTDVTVGQQSASIIENVIVTGQRASSANALNRQRSSDTFISALSADNIGNFPDQNVAEATRRLPGLSVQNDQGEGRFVVIRGIDPNLNATTVNGQNLPSPQRGGRQVALDVIPSELLSGLVVKKTNTPDMDGDAIGGTVEIETLSPFERRGFWATVRAEGSYNDFEDEYSPRVSGAFSNLFGEDERIGIAAAISWQDRDFGSDNIEIDRGFPTNAAGVTYPGELELRNYVISRERLGAALNIDFRATDSTELYMKSLYSDFSDLELRNRHEFRFRDDTAIRQTGNVIQIADDIQIDRESKERVQDQKILSILVGGETQFDNWFVEYSAGYAKAEEEEVDRIDTTFRRRFGVADEPTLLVEVDQSDPLKPFVRAGNAATRALINDLSNYGIDEFELTDNTVDDEEYSFKLDITHDIEVADNPGFIKFGGKMRLREKDNNEQLRTNDAFPLSPDGDAFTAADFSKIIDYDLGEYGPGIDQAAVRALTKQEEANFTVEVVGSFAGDYTAEEDIFAGYIMGKLDVDNLTITGGFRVEYTDFASTGFNVDKVTEVVTPISGENNYVSVLPSVSLRYETESDWIFRAAYSKTVSRPIISNVVTRTSIDGTEAVIGNPDLEPYEADNIDVGVEYYPTRLSVVSLGLFYKSIGEFIFNEDVAGQPGFTAFTRAIRPDNGESADLAGIELHYQQSLDFLPEPFDGLLVSGAYNYTYSNAELPDGRDVPLSEQPKHVATASIGYEKGPISLRAAFAYRSRRLVGLNEDGFSDIYEQPHLQVDLSGKYNFNDNIQIYSEVSNLNDEPLEVTFANRKLLRQFEEYGFTVSAGVRYTF